MSVNVGMNIVDASLNLAIDDLVGQGIQRNDAQIALLIRLTNIVPQDVSQIALMLLEDPEMLRAINTPTGPGDGQSKAV